MVDGKLVDPKVKLAATINTMVPTNAGNGFRGEGAVKITTEDLAMCGGLKEGLFQVGERLWTCIVVGTGGDAAVT